MGVDVGQVEFVRLNAFTEEVVFDVDVFNMGVEERVFRHGLGSGVVAIDSRWG